MADIGHAAKFTRWQHPAVGLGVRLAVANIACLFCVFVCENYFKNNVLVVCTVLLGVISLCIMSDRHHVQIFAVAAVKCLLNECSSLRRSQVCCTGSLRTTTPSCCSTNMFDLVS